MKVAGYIEHTHDVLHHNGLQQLNIQSTLHSCLLPQFKPCSQCSYSHEISYKRSESTKFRHFFHLVIVEEDWTRLTESKLEEHSRQRPK